MFEPFVSGGIVLGFTMDATLPRRNGREHLIGKRDPVNDQNTLEALLKIIKPFFTAPIGTAKKDSWKTIVNKYKSCQQSDGTDISILNESNIGEFKKRIAKDYFGVLSDVKAFVADFIDTDENRR
jgi:hypothetical protein